MSRLYLPRGVQDRAAPVAQLDRALPSEGRGREFESRRVRHHINDIENTAANRVPVVSRRRDLLLSRSRDVWPPDWAWFLVRFRPALGVVGKDQSISYAPPSLRIGPCGEVPER